MKWMLVTDPNNLEGVPETNHPCVYAMQFANGTSKIGFSRTPKQRIKFLLSGLSLYGGSGLVSRIAISPHHKNATRLEARIHHELRDKHIHREVFAVTIEEVGQKLFGEQGLRIMEILDRVHRLLEHMGRKIKSRGHATEKEKQAIAILRRSCQGMRDAIRLRHAGALSAAARGF